MAGEVSTRGVNPTFTPAGRGGPPGGLPTRPETMRTALGQARRQAENEQPTDILTM